MSARPEDIQRRYYAETAERYDTSHLHEDDGHMLALRYITDVTRANGFASVLDVGAGTGRAMLYLTEMAPELDVHGIEPVAELIAQGHEKGISPEALVQGDGNALPYPDGAFDVVIETGMLHHVPRPARVVAEMLRVAR
ncbi:MAG: class I SAM-dependent methyltransferase, partial [Myxococcales bacterium]|nr:class I SAM-dependent methyltransferase [Myxococcales bacterium]